MGVLPHTFYLDEFFYIIMTQCDLINKNHLCIPNSSFCIVQDVIAL